MTAVSSIALYKTQVETFIRAFVAIFIRHVLTCFEDKKRHK